MQLTSDTKEGKLILIFTVVICFLIIALGAGKLQAQARLTEVPVTTTMAAMTTAREVTTTAPVVTSTKEATSTTAVVTTTKEATTTTAVVTTTPKVTTAASTSTSKQKLGAFTITGYCPCQACSGSWGRGTASGATATAGRTIAASSAFPYGTKLYIEGLGTYVVQDRGGAVTGRRIDVFFNTHSEAEVFGKQTRTVYRVS